MPVPEPSTAPDRLYDLQDLVPARYHLLGRLRGAPGGALLRARDEVTGLEVALELVPASGGPEATARLRREARLLSDLRSPHLVRVLDAGTVQGHQFLVTLPVPERTLRDRLSQGPLGVQEAIGLFLGFLEGLRLVHGRGLVHRDLRPEHLLVDRCGRGRLAGFRLLRESGSRLTSAGTRVGQVRYCAPEQLLSHEVDARADLYSLGTCLFEALTGRPPFSAESEWEGIHEVLSAAPPPPRALRPEIPEEFEGLVLRLLEKRPAERPGSAEEAARELARLSGGVPQPGAWEARVELLGRQADLLAPGDSDPVRSGMPLGSLDPASLAVLASRAAGRALDVSEQRWVAHRASGSERIARLLGGWLGLGMSERPRCLLQAAVDLARALDPAERRLLAALALARAPLSLPVLAATSGLDPGDTLVALRSLERRGLLEASPGRLDVDFLSSAVLARAVLSTVGAEEESRLRRLLLRGLLEEAEETPELLAALLGVPLSVGAAPQEDESSEETPDEGSDEAREESLAETPCRAPEAIAPEIPSGLRLRILLAPQFEEGAVLEFPGSEVIVGRGEHCHLHFPSPSVSRRHLRIAWGEAGPVAEPLSLHNVTLLNGAPLPGPRPLAPGDTLQLADQVLLQWEGSLP